MYKVFYKTFEENNIVNQLNEDGFDVHNTGGSFQPDYASGTVSSIGKKQLRVAGTEDTILTCSTEVFYKTLCDVEKRFKYKSFG